MSTFATRIADGRMAGSYTRDQIIQALREYAERYGVQPTAACFSPASAKWTDRPDARERYYAGRADGSPWPSLNSIKRPFNGSFNEAMLAAGFELNKSGPASRRPSGRHAPIRTIVDHRIPVPSVKHKQLSDELDRVRGQRDRARARADRAEQRLAERPKTVTKTKTKVRTEVRRVEDTRKVARLTERLADSRAVSMALRDQLKATQQDLDRATLAVATTDNQKTEMLTRALAEAAQAHAAVLAAEDRAETLEQALEAAERLPQRDNSELIARVRRAEQRAAVAERAAKDVEQRMADQAAAITGHRRALTRAEIVELHQNGPAGPALLAAALKQLAKARASRSNMHKALTDVASAALSWRDRLR